MQPFVNSVVKNCLASRRLDVAVVLALEIGGVGRSRRLVVRLLRLVLYCCHSGPFYILLNSPPGNLFSGAINVRHKNRIVGEGSETSAEVVRAMPLGRKNVEMEKATRASAPFENSNSGGPSCHLWSTDDRQGNAIGS